MGQAEELIRMGKKLDKMVSRKNMEGALDLLKKLKSCTMTIQLLQMTRIGIAVNSIRKHSSDEEVVALAKVLIKNWKRLLESPESQKSKKEKERLKRDHIPALKAEEALSHQANVCKSPDGKQKDRKLHKSNSQEADPKSCSSVVPKPDRDPEGALSTSKKFHLDLKKERRDSEDLNSSAVASSSTSLSSSSPKRSSGDRFNNKPKQEEPKTPTSPITPTFTSSVCFLASCYLTGDSIRDKCIEMISAALKMGGENRSSSD